MTARNGRESGSAHSSVGNDARNGSERAMLETYHDQLVSELKEVERRLQDLRS